MSDIAFQVVGYLFGPVFVVSLLSFMSWRHSHYWRELAAVYPAAGERSGRKFHMETVYLYADYKVYNRHRGTVTVTLDDSGVQLSMMPFMSTFYPPIFLPFDQISVSQDDWLLMGRVCHVRFTDLPELNMVMPGRSGELLLEQPESNALFQRYQRAQSAS